VLFTGDNPAPTHNSGNSTFTYSREISPSVTYLSRTLTFGTKKVRRAPTTPGLLREASEVLLIVAGGADYGRKR
jgi:hypothetical protein